MPNATRMITNMTYRSTTTSTAMMTIISMNTAASIRPNRIHTRTDTTHCAIRTCTIPISIIATGIERRDARDG